MNASSFSHAFQATHAFATFHMPKPPFSGRRLVACTLGIAALSLLAACGGGGGGGGGFIAAAPEEAPAELPAPTSDPSPVHDVLDQDLSLELSWAGETASFELFFGPNELPAEATAVVEDTRFEIDDLKVDTLYLWRVDSVLEDGSVVAGPLWSFTTGNPFLQAVKFSPAGGERNVQPTDLVIAVEFDEEIAEASVDAGSFFVATDEGERLRGRHEVDGNIARFIPEAFLAPSNAKLTVNLSGILSTVGRELQADVASSFRTGEYELIRVNFQSENAEVPAGNLRDFGLPFDERSELNSGRGLSYGWVRDDGTPIDSSRNARERGELDDPRLNSFIHMQNTGIDVSWEMEVPNGSYEVTVALGEGAKTNRSPNQTAVVEGWVAIDRFTPNPPEEQHAFATLTVLVNDGRLTIAPTGGDDTKIPFVEIRPLDRIRLSVNFQKENAEVPFGDLRDFGQAFGERQDRNQGSGLSYGWVLAGTQLPEDRSGDGRDRNVNEDQRLDTLMHFQQSATVAWEIALPAGLYSVRVAAGDAANLGSVHVLNVEGTVAIDGFVPTPDEPHAEGNVFAFVIDGFLTIDPGNGANTKIHFVEIQQF